jgi:Collagen triple helix repeat (20 copies)
MFSRLREHFGTAGLVVAIVALIAALAGGAIAATGGSNNGKATASAKGKQGPRGKAGKTGPQGPAGPAGAQGPAGAKGDTGAPGSNGSNGKDGAPGPTGATGPTGLAGKNGETGFTEFLPSGKTETGTWAVGPGGVGAVNFGAETAPPPASQLVPISFPIPLEEAPELIFVQMTEGPNAEPFVDAELEQLQEEGAEHGCAGLDEGIPLADPGKLCVYGSSLNAMQPPAGSVPFTRTKLPSGPPQVFAGGGIVTTPGGSQVEAGGGLAGTTLRMQCGASNCEAIGVWAVTAE